jgi:hypothetical protein
VPNPKSPSEKQICAAGTPPAAAPSGSDTIISADKIISVPDNNIAQNNLGDAIGLLKTLPEGTRQPAMGCGDTTA